MTVPRAARGLPPLRRATAAPCQPAAGTFPSGRAILRDLDRPLPGARALFPAGGFRLFEHTGP